MEEQDRSWCSSSRSNDHRAITIEVASDTKHPYKVTDQALAALIDLLVDICRRNGIKALLWKGDKSLIGQVDKQNMTVHRWFANKACPGDYLYNLHPQIAAQVNEGNTMKRRRFKQLTRADRLNIEKYLRQGMTKQAVADALGVSLRTVYYELKRGQYIHTNSDLTEEVRYSCDVAESVKKYNGTNKGPQLKIGNDHELAAYIERRIVEDGYSPAAVLGEIRVKGMKFKTSICKSTLYSYIRKGVFLTLEMRDLPRHGKNKRGYTRTHKKGARASAGTSIEHRPEEVNARTTVGHWEMDSVLGKKKTKPALLVLSERLSRKELIIKVQDHTAASVVRALDRLERKMGSPAFRATFKSITVDNGSEFADVDGMERSCRRKGPRTKVYYCHPYSSWERGTNENTNGLIRRWFPKGTDFSKVSVREIRKVEDWLNAYPREILGFLSADAVFSTAFAACV